jgi:hypothetical protein
MVDKVALGQVHTAPHPPSSIVWGWYNRPVVSSIPNELTLIPLRIIIKM